MFMWIKIKKKGIDMSEHSAVSAEGAVKIKTKRVAKPKASNSYVVTSKTGTVVNFVKTDLELAALLEAQPGSEAWVVGKRVRGCLRIPGHHDLIKNVKSPDKVMVALDK